MGVFSRFMDIVNANINSMLDKAEDPEKTIKLMLQEMEDTLIEMKSSCAAKMAKRATVHRQVVQQQEVVNRWQSRAELAVTKGYDELAREALIEKKKAESDLVKIEEEESRCEDLIRMSKSDIVKLEDKLNSVKLKYQSILERSQRAREAKRAEASYQETAESETLRRFREMEERLDRMNHSSSQASSQTKTTEQRFMDIEDTEDIEKELQELRKKSGK